MHSQAIIERGWRCTWRPWSSGIRGELWGSWWEVRRVYSIDQVVILYPWECDKVTLPLSSHGELAGCCRSCRETHWKLKLHSGVNSQSWEWRKGKQSWVDAVLSLCCTWCMLYLVYAVLGVCCTLCILYSVYAVHSVNIWSWHGKIERDNLAMCSAMMVELWTRKRGGGWIWEQYGASERKREIRGKPCLIGFRWPRISIITRWIGTHTCHIRNGKLTSTRNSVKPQFAIMISHLLSSLCFSFSTRPSPKNTKLSYPSLSLHARIMR